MGWVKSQAELEAYYSFRVREFDGAKMLGVMFETRPETVAAVIPPPLMPGDLPTGLIFIAQYPETNLGPGYREAALFLSCKYGEETGSYCLSMPIDSEPSRLHNGRDIYGFPKKMAQIHLEKDGEKAHGYVERFGIRFLEIEAELSGELNELPPIGASFLFKGMPRADLTPGFDGPVYLVRQQTDIHLKRLTIGQAQVTLRDSDRDPWSEIPLVNVLAAFYLESDNRMLPGEVVAEVDPMTYLPYSFKGVDFYTGK